MVTGSKSGRPFARELRIVGRVGRLDAQDSSPAPAWSRGGGSCSLPETLRAVRLGVLVSIGHGHGDCPSRRSRMSPSSPACSIPAAVLSLVAAFAPSGRAQCTNTWLTGYGCPGANLPLTAGTHWDADGSGPAPALVAIGGAFSLIGTLPAEGLALWQPATGAWSSLPPPPLPGPGSMLTTAMTTLPSGELVVAFGASSSATTRVARWNGTTWSVLGLDFPAQVTGLLVRPNGELIAGGEFVGGVAAFVGATWQSVGGGVDGSVRGMANGGSGELLVGGGFDHAGGIAASGVAQWNGTTWSAVGNFSGYASSLATVPGRLFVGNDLGLQQWDGTAWTTVPGLGAAPFPYPTIHSVAALPSGRVVAGGYISSAGGTPTRNVAVYDPVAATWSTLGSGLAGYGTTQTAAVIELAGGDLLVGGSFADAGGTLALHVARWNGTQWSAVGDGFVTTPNCVEVTGPTEIVVGGRSDGIPGGVVHHAGGVWAPLGGGVAGINAAVGDLLRLPNGDLLAGGTFSQAGGVPARSLARWDGSAWSEFAGGIGGFVLEVLRRANGDLVVVGGFTDAGGVPCSNIAVWNGATWSPLGAGSAALVTDVAETPGGDLLVATQSGGLAAVWRWDGVAWATDHVAGVGESIADIAVLDDGGLVIAGTATPAFSSNGKAYLDVVASSGVIRHASLDFRSAASVLHRLPGGDLVVGGTFRSLGAIVCDGLARWTGGSAGVLVPMLAGSGAVDVATFANGDLLLGGLATVPGTSVWLVGCLSTTCPAGALPTSAGCGSGALLPRTLPWIGTTLESEATGMPAFGVAIDVRGFGTTSIPLSSVLPLGLPGCDLAVSDDILELHVPVAGVVRTALPIPPDVALVGLVLHEQVVAFAASAGGVFSALSSTNRLSHAIGAF